MLFFDTSGAVLFERSDMESGSIVHEEMSLQALFPYDAERVIHRGMRVGLTDAVGAFQAYEIRKVKTYEPDHYQEITAEHICISELTDEFFGDAEWSNITAQAALTQLLNGTGWAVGSVYVSGTSSANITNGDVWSDVRSIERAWNCHIIPRLTVDSHGITGKYLDIIPPDGVWRGLRLSLDKNADEMGVTWDDSRVKTALYAFGKSIGTTSKDAKPITFKDVVWASTADHPAKPAGQEYLEDPEATTLYGRNGRPRFAYYQNGDISDPNILLEKTWESLKNLNHPDVTIDCLVTDLYRLGYNDVPLRLYDLALTEIRPTGTVLHKQIVQYTEDLIDPSQSRVSIGTYIPNIIYINKENSAGSKGGGGGGQSKKQFEDSTFKAWFDANATELIYTVAELEELGGTVAANVASLEVNRNNIVALVAGEGAQIVNGRVLVDANGEPIFQSGKGLYSKIEQNSAQIALKVSNGEVATQLSVECGNVHITGTPGAANLVVDGYVEADTIFSASASHESIYAIDINASGTVYCEDLETSGTGTITTAAIEAYSLTLSGNPITECIVNASVSGSTLTLTKDDGTTITFNKAVSLSGAWSGRRYIVTANPPQLNSPVGIVYDGLVPTGNITKSGKSVSRDYIVYSDDGEGNADSIIMQKTVTINASDVFDDGVAEGESKFALTTVQLQGESAGTVYKRKTSGSLRLSRYSSSSVELFIYERNQYYSVGNHVWWYQSNNGTYYYLGDGSDNALFKPGQIVTDTYYTKST